MADRQLFGDLRGRQYSLLSQHLALGFEAAPEAHMGDHAGVERLAEASGSSASIEDVGDLGIRVVVQQLADFGDERGGKLGRMLGGLQRDIQLTDRASPQAHPGMGTIAMAGQRDVLDQQADHALFLAVRRRGVVPQPGEVGREFQDALANRLIEQAPVLVAKAVALIFRVTQGLQASVPFALENVGDEPVSGIDLHEAPLGQLSGLAVALHGLVAEPKPKTPDVDLGI